MPTEGQRGKGQVGCGLFCIRIGVCLPHAVVVVVVVVAFQHGWDLNDWLVAAYPTLNEHKLHLRGP